MDDENKICINTQIFVSYDEYEKNMNCLKQLFEKDFRLMDTFTLQTLYTCYKLLKSGISVSDNYNTGLCLSTFSGAGSSVKEAANNISENGYTGINPSKFPNVMLSTALMYTARYLNTHGSSCVLIERDKFCKDALDYGKVMLFSGKCKSFIVIFTEENMYSEGWFLTNVC